MQKYDKDFMFDNTYMDQINEILYNFAQIVIISQRLLTFIWIFLSFRPKVKFTTAVIYRYRYLKIQIKLFGFRYPKRIKIIEILKITHWQLVWETEMS